MSDLTAPSTRRTILPVQYLRGLAAMMVVWHHALAQVPGVSRFFSPGLGAPGVDLFFVISGFIMVASSARNASTPGEFMRRRIIRVVPMYWLLTLAMVVLALCAPRLFKTLVVAPGPLIDSLLFIPHFSHSFPDMVWPLLVPGWTLNFEMFFYAAFALTLFLPACWRVPTLAAAFGLLVGIGLVCGPFASAAARVYFSPLLVEFVVGAAIGAWWQRGGRPLGTVLSSLALVSGFVLLAIHAEPPQGEFTHTLGAALMVTGALNDRFLNWNAAPLRALGDSSYSLYLSHVFTLGLLRVVWMAVFPPVDTWLSAAGFMAAALAGASLVGWLLFLWLETPMLDWLKLRTQPRRDGLRLASTGLQ